MLGGWARGIAGFIGLVLVVAGSVKLLDREPTPIALSRLVTRRRAPTRGVAAFVVVVGLGLGEVALGLVLGLARPGTPIALVTFGLCVGFVLVVLVARRRGLACGCFSSFSSTTPGPVELARALSLLVLSAFVLAVEATRPHGRVDVLGVVAGLVTALAVLAGSMIAVSPRRSLRSLLAISPQHLDRAWLALRPRTRRRWVAAVHADPIVRDVEARMPVPVRWRDARVAVARRQRFAAIVIPGHRARLQIVVPLSGGPLAVVGFTPSGAIVPRSMTRSAAHVSGGDPLPLSRTESHHSLHRDQAGSRSRAAATRVSASAT